MKVDLLYFDGCPIYRTALKHLQDIINQHGLEAEKFMVKVESDAGAKRLGPPSIRINAATGFFPELSYLSSISPWLDFCKYPLPSGDLK